MVAHLSWAIWAIAHSRSFDLSKISKWANERWAKSQPWLTLIRRNQQNFWFFKNLQKNCKITYKKYDFFEYFGANSSFFVSKRENKLFAKKNLAICSFSHLSWATCVNHLNSLICHEGPGRFAHSYSFVLSDLSELLTFAHFVYAIWANERMSDEQMSKFPTLEMFSFLKKNHNFVEICMSTTTATTTKCT